MDNVGIGGLLALGWVVLAAYIVLLLALSIIFAIKRGIESAYETFSAWYRRAPIIEEVTE